MGTMRILIIKERLGENLTKMVLFEPKKNEF